MTDNKKDGQFNRFVEGGDKTKQIAVDSHEPVQAKPLQVEVRDGGFDRAMKIFKSMVQKERILAEYKTRQSFEKKSDKIRRKRNEAIRAIQQEKIKPKFEEKEEKPRKQPRYRPEEE